VFDYFPQQLLMASKDCNRTAPCKCHSVEQPTVTDSSSPITKASLTKLKLAALQKKARSSAKGSGLKNRKGKKSEQSYNGPVDSARFDNQTVVVLMMLKYQASYTYTSGTAATVWPNNPNNDPGWSSLAAEFDEYRCLGMDLHYIKWDPYQTSEARPPIASVVDHSGDTTALTSYDNAIQYESSQMHSSVDNWKRTWKASGFEELSWTPTASPIVTGSIKTYSTTGGTPGIPGKVLLDMLIEFRGKL